jgi:hypothetical protein
MRSPCCLCNCVCLCTCTPSHQLWNSWTWYVYHGTWAHLNSVLHKSLPSVSVAVCISPSIIATQRLGKHVPAATNTCNNKRIIGRFILFAVCVVSKESLWVSLCIALLLLGNGSVNSSLWQWRIVEGVVFYAFRVMLKGSRRLVIPRTFVDNI